MVVASPGSACKDEAVLYDYVIVPFDGTEATRVGHAPAADLAWRCQAKVVMIASSKVSSKAATRLIKDQAMGQSGDVDFWVDTESPSLGAAVAEAGRHRPNSVICIVARLEGRKKRHLDSLADEVLSRATVPVVTLGPEVDLRSRLPVSRVIACLDGTEKAEEIMPVVASWAVQLRLNVSVVGVAGPEGETPPGMSIDYLHAHAAFVADHIEAELEHIPFGKPTAVAQMLAAATPAQALVGISKDEYEAILVMGTHSNADRPRGVLGDVALDVLRESHAPVIFVPIR